jgi:protein-tyrosine phosphatase
MVHVLFVCLGNICRSPMAEAVFRHLVKEEGLEKYIGIDSAGTGGWHEGEPAHQGTREVLKKHGILHDYLVARQIKPIDFEQFDYIVCMDEENLTVLRRMAPPGKQIYRLLDFASEAGEENVEDPYYTGRFLHVYELVQAGSKGLLAHIKKEHALMG